MNRKLILTGIMSLGLFAISACSHSPVKDGQSNELAPTIASTAATKEPLNLKMVHFGFDSSVLTEESKDLLKKNAEALVKDPSLTVQVQGFCDERGGSEYNLGLGQRRAKAVQTYLISQGVSPDRVSTLSMGKDHPMDPTHSESAYSKNRRASFAVNGQPTHSLTE